MIKKKYILILLLIAYSFAGYSQDVSGETKTVDYSVPQEYEIAEINVTGTKFLDGNTLVSLTGLRIGDRIRIPGDDISNAIKKLWKHGLVGDVKVLLEKVEDGKAYINVHLTERPRLSKSTFTGISRTQQTELSELISLYRGKVLTDAIIKNTENNVKNHFVDKGFLNVQVDLKQVPDTLLTNHVKLLIHVKKNAKVKIDRIYFEGAAQVSEGSMKGKMKNTKERVRFTLFHDFVKVVYLFR